MKKGTLISVRSNCNFGLNYQTSHLHPQAEIIIITTEPEYKVKGSTLSKTQSVKELRFNANLEGINQLIGELQLVVKNMNAFDQLAGSINAMVESAKEKKDGDNK